jgi:hypothetical protein
MIKTILFISLIILAAKASDYDNNSDSNISIITDNDTNSKEIEVIDNKKKSESNSDISIIDSKEIEVVVKEEKWESMLQENYNNNAINTDKEDEDDFKSICSQDEFIEYKQDNIEIIKNNGKASQENYNNNDINTHDNKIEFEDGYDTSVEEDDADHG